MIKSFLYNIKIVISYLKLLFQAIFFRDLQFFTDPFNA